MYNYENLVVLQEINILPVFSILVIGYNYTWCLKYLVYRI